MHRSRPDLLTQSTNGTEKVQLSLETRNFNALTIHEKKFHKEKITPSENIIQISKETELKSFPNEELIIFDPLFQ